MEVAQDEKRFAEPAVLLQGHGQLVLAGVGLELRYQQGRRHVALGDRGADAEQLVPMLGDALGVYALAHQGVDEGRDSVLSRNHRRWSARSRIRGENLSPTKSKTAKTRSV